jgi:hypothetical protein
VEHFLATLATASGFTGFFLAFSLSLDFWGRLLLKALRAGGAAEPDGPLPCLAAMAALCAICRWLSFFTNAFERPFACFIALGVLGSALELARKARAASRLPEGGGGRALAELARGYEWALSSGLAAFALGFWFAWIWPSGGLEPWLSPSADYYSWMFNAAYWTGHGDAETFGIMHHYWWIFDGFGALIVFALYASARGLETYMAFSGFAVTLLAWSGGAAYLLARRLAGLPRALAWLAAMAVAGGAFSRFLVFYGATGQLAATFGYVMLLHASLSAPLPPRAAFARLFFPILYLLMCYQAGFLMFAAIAAGALFLAGAFRDGLRCRDGEAAGQAPAGGKGGGPGRRPVTGALRAAAGAARPVLAATLLAAAVSPQTAWQTVLRTGSAASQQAGYGTGLLDPGLFAGFPLIRETPFGLNAGVPPLAWAVFLACLGLLGLIALRRGARTFPAADRAGLKAALCLFAAFLAAYLALFAWKGDVYQFWKFASMTALPISFLPAALLILAIREGCRGRPRPFALALALAAAAVALPQLLYSNPRGARRAIDDMKSLVPVVDVVGQVLEADRGEVRAVFDFSTPERNFTAAILARYGGVHRVGFVNGIYMLPSFPNYLKFAEMGAPIYTDSEYPGLFKGAPGVIRPEFTVFRHDMGDLRRSGAVAFIGFDDVRDPIMRVVRLRILPPQSFAGRDSAVRIAFAEGLAGLDLSCRGVTAREALARPEEAVRRAGSEFVIRAPREWQRAGYINLILSFYDLPVLPRQDGSAWDPADPPVCRYRIDSVEILAPEDGPPGGGGSHESAATGGRDRG